MKRRLAKRSRKKITVAADRIGGGNFLPGGGGDSHASWDQGASHLVLSERAVRPSIMHVRKINHHQGRASRLGTEFATGSAPVTRSNFPTRPGQQILGASPAPTGGVGQVESGSCRQSNCFHADLLQFPEIENSGSAPSQIKHLSTDAS